MKKLMTMLATAAMAFGLYADTPSIISGAGFDSSDTGTPSLLTWNASGFVNGFWTGTNAENAVITAGGLPSAYENRPAFFVKSVDPTRSHSDYLAVATKPGEEIGMNVKENGGAQIIGADGLYFDGLVKFTAFDEFPTIANDAKIAVFPMLNDPEDESAGTNLYVKAWGTTTNIWKTATSIDDEDWHRVTIKAISDILAGADTHQVGFVVYVDGEMIGLPLGVKSDFKSATLTPEANYYNNNGFLFGALGTYSTSLTQVGFSGKGGIDEIVFTEVAPDFAKSPMFKKVAWDAGVEGFVCGNFSTNGLTEAGSVTFQYEGAKPMVTQNSVTFNDGKILDKIEADANNDETIYPKTGAAVLTIGTVKTGFATVAAAFVDLNDLTKYAAATTAGLKLNTGSGAVALNNKNIALTLDLNGQEIKNEEGDAITVTAGALTIIDSDPNKQGKVIAGCYVNGEVTEYSYAVSADAAVVMIQAGTFDGVMSLGTGRTITGGKFLIAANEAGSLNAWKPEGYEFVAKDGYWELKEITGYTLSIDPSIVNGTVTTVPAASKVEAGTTVTVTATPADGYNLSSITTNNATIAGNTFVMPEDNVVVSATFVAIQYATLTVVKGDANVTAVVVSNATKEVALDAQGQAKFDKDAAVVITVYPTFATGYELDTTRTPTLTATMTADATITVYAKAAAPIPPLPAEPTADQVNAAVDAAKFADTTVKTMIGGDPAKYTAFKTWADGVTGGEAAVVASAHAADSYLLGQTKLLQNAPASEIKTIAKTSDTALTLTFEIKDGANAVTVAQTAADYVKTLVQCNEKVDFGNGTKIDATVGVAIDGTTLTATVTLPPNKPAAFMKVAK